MFDVSLLVTLAAIFAATLLGSYLQTRRKDPCLGAFDGYHVTLQLENGKLIWGELQVEPSGLELCYRRAVQDGHHLETSYVLYADEYGQIHAFFRFADELTPENQARREQDIRRSFHPNFWQRSKRRLRTFLATARESMAAAVGVLVGRARKPAARYITDTGETYLKQLGVDAISHAGTSYDPLLERFIGRKVVVEMLEGGEVHEHVGILKNYTADFLEILDVQYPFPQSVSIGEQDHPAADWLEWTRTDEGLVVHNRAPHPLFLRRLVSPDGQEVPLSAVVAPDEEAHIQLPQDFLHGRMEVRRVRELDMVIPTTRGVIRHRAEHLDQDMDPLELLDRVFDVGYLIRQDERTRRREEALRARLAQDHLNGPAAVELATLLIQRGDLDEAERWLRPVLTIRRSLPDNGRRAEMLLREIQRKRGQQALVA